MRGLRLLLYVGLAALCLTTWLVWSMQRLTIQPEPFNSARWKEMAAAGHMNNDPGCYRGAMALGAIESRELIGKSSVELSTLLGRPENTAANRWLYPVGQCSGDWVHSTLVITFSNEGVVADAELRRES